MSRLRERYEKEVIPALMQRFGYKNAMQVPRLQKIVVIRTGAPDRELEIAGADSGDAPDSLHRFAEVSRDPR